MNEDLKRWDEAAEEWTTTGSGNGMFRPLLIGPVLTKLLGVGSGKKLLDAGCGDGIYTKLAADAGFIVSGLDGSANMVSLAQKKYPDLTFEVQDLLEPFALQNNSFDVVLSILVFMSLSRIETFLNESFRILKPEGALIVAVRHPAFSNPVMVLYKTLQDKILSRRPKGLAEDYYLGKQDYRAWEKGPALNIPYYPRTFEQYSAEFKKAGFVIDSMFEPHELPEDFLKKYPKLEYATRLPRFIFFKLIKVSPQS
jgi:ubiquinone/menaquinone biosynthesis C-methylase UbiE